MATMKKAKNGLKEPNNPGLKQLPTPVRNKMGFKKNGGAMKAKMGASIKKAANGTTTTKTTVKPVLDVKSGMNSAREVINGMQTISSPQKTTKPTRPTRPTTPTRLTPMNNLPPEEAKRRYMRPADTSPERFPTSGVSSNVTAKRGKTISKAKSGTKMKMGGKIKKAQMGGKFGDMGKSTPSMPSIPTGNNAGSSQKKPIAKSGASMKKCKYGCK